MFRFMGAGRYSATHFYNTKMTPKRTVEYYELEIIHTSSAHSYIDGVPFLHSNGTVILARPNQQRFSVGTFQCDYVHFFCDEPVVTDCIERLPFCFNIGDSSKICNIINSIKNETDTLKCYKAVIELLLMLTEIKSESDKTATLRDRYVENIIAVKDYIDTNYQKKLTLKTLQCISFLSQNFMRIKFKEIIGLSPHEYLNKVRLAHLTDMLINTDKTVNEICFECGFESVSYMDAVFKKNYRKTPLEYRKNKRAM